MVIGTDITIAIHCPICGKLELHTISIFNFADGTLHLSCSCGGHKFAIKAKNKKKYTIETECAICEGKHSIPLATRDFLSGELICICCPETQIELGFIGPFDKVKEKAENYLEDIEQILQDVGFDDYFDNPEAMFEAFNYLHDVAERKGLSCRCGNTDIKVDIFTDRIELTCKACGGKGFIYVRNEKDLEVLRSQEKIFLTLQGIKGGLE